MFSIVVVLGVLVITMVILPLAPTSPRLASHIIGRNGGKGANIQVTGYHHQFWKDPQDTAGTLKKWLGQNGALDFLTRLSIRIVKERRQAPVVIL
jgi:hypothetical protein